MDSLNFDLEPVVALLLHRLTSGPLRLVVTSAWPGEGKSTITWTLAQCIANLKSKSVLIVDGDLRNPTLSGQMQLGPQGLAELHRGKELKPVCLDPTRALYGLGAGYLKRDASEVVHSILAGGQLPNYLAGYDLVLFDTPPLTAAEDALLFAEICSSVLLVVSVNSRFRGAAPLQLERFRERNIPILGAVVTHAKAENLRGHEFLRALGLRS